MISARPACDSSGDPMRFAMVQFPSKVDAVNAVLVKNHYFFSLFQVSIDAVGLTVEIDSLYLTFSWEKNS